MSWEETYRHNFPCPCGKGFYEEVGYSNDWNQYETRRTMLCPDCAGNYRYVDSNYPAQYQHKFFARAHGWVHIDVLKEEEERLRAAQEEEARQAALLKAQYEPSIRTLLMQLRSKKDLCKFLQKAGCYSLSSFYRHTKSMSYQEVVEKELDRLFSTTRYAEFIKNSTNQ